MRANSPTETYQGRYPLLRARRGIWREIVRYVEPDMPSGGRVLELGAGYCDFINQVTARQKIAFDLNPEMQAFAAPDVDLRIESAIALEGLPDVSIDFAFASNFFEHLSHDDGLSLLRRLHQVLRPGGRLALIQPNHTRCAEHYFDDPTHVTVYSDATMGAFLYEGGFWVRRLEPGLLPFSMKSRLPKWPVLTRAYLRSPLRPWSAQMYVLAERA